MSQLGGSRAVGAVIWLAGMLEYIRLGICRHAGAQAYVGQAIWSAGLGVTALLLSACVPGTKLSDGRLSQMEPGDNSTRMGLQIDKSAAPAELSYLSSGTCDYSENLTFTTGAQRQNDMRISIKPVKGNVYFVVDRNDGKVSGYLMDHTGRLQDFNSESISTGERYNKEKFEQVGQRPNSNITTNSTVVTEFSLEFPEYRRHPRAPGDTAATIRGEDGAVWASYKYVGMTNYNGSRAAVFDIVRDAPGLSGNEPILVGFSIVDARTAMPILLVYRQASSIRLERISCS